MSDEGKCAKGGACKGTGWVMEPMEIVTPGGKTAPVLVHKTCPHCSSGTFEEILTSPAMDSFFKE